jgi:hypothetical protein
MIVGITGTRALDDTGRQNLYDALSILDPARDSVIVGGCVGADAFAALVATSFGLPLFLCYPAEDKAWMSRWFDPDCMLLQTTGWEATFTTRQRNQYLVQSSDQVWAFPDRAEGRDNPRSGTWMTVRMARKAGKLGLCLPQH